MNVGYVNLYRDLHGSFSANERVDYQCWQVYVHLLENSFWKDGEKYKAGQVKKTVPEISKRIWLTERVIRTSLGILCHKGYIKQDRASKWRKDGFIYTISDVRQVSDRCKTDVRQVEDITHEELKEKECLENTDVRQVSDRCKTDVSILREEERRKKKEGRKNTDIGTTYLTPPDVIEVAEYWNQVVVNLPKIRVDKIGILKKRLDAAKNTISHFGIDDCKAAVDKVSRSDFLNGRAQPRREGEKPFSAKFDWLMKVENITKVLEGNYDNDKKSKAIKELFCD